MLKALAAVAGRVDKQPTRVMPRMTTITIILGRIMATIVHDKPYLMRLYRFDGGLDDVTSRGYSLQRYE